MALSWDDALSILIPLLAAAPFFIAARAYQRTRTTRVLLFALAFAALFARGLVVAAEVWIWPGNSTLDALELVSDALVLVLFTMGMLKA